MRKNRALIIIAALVAFCVLVYRASYPSYAWNQRLTLTVSTPDGPVTGSAVIEVRHWFHPSILVDAGERRDSLRGEAVVVDLGGGRYLFALLSGSLRMVDAAFGERLPELVFGGAPLKRYLRGVQRLRDEAPLPPEALPRLVSFAEIGDPTSVILVDPGDLSAAFGAGYALTGATLAITRDAVTEGRVEQVLGWLEERGREFSNVKGKPESGLVSEQPNPEIYMISPSDFSSELYK